MSSTDRERRDWLASARERETDSALTAANVEDRIRAVEKIGQHGWMPNYWREALFLAFTADDIAVQKLCAELDALAASLGEATDALRAGERLRELRAAEANWPGCDGGDADPAELLLLGVRADVAEADYEALRDRVLARFEGPPDQQPPGALAEPGDGIRTVGTDRTVGTNPGSASASPVPGPEGNPA